MRWRRLLLSVLLALTFDAVVPFEPTAAGTLQLDDDLEEAAQLRARRDHRREVAAARRSSSPSGVTIAPRIHASLPRLVRPHRLEPRVHLAAHAADPAAAPAASGEDH